MQNFCYATGNYSLVMLHNYEKKIIEFPHHLIPAVSENEKKKEKLTRKQKSASRIEHRTSQT